MLTLKEQELQRIERLRGWIVYLIYKNRPEPVELAVLTDSLDKFNFPLSRRNLAIELNYLRSKGLLVVFPLNGSDLLDRVEQAKLLQRYSSTESDSEMKRSLCVLLTSLGDDFQEHNATASGITRVE